MHVGDLHSSVSDPSGGTVNPDPAEPRIGHLFTNSPAKFSVVLAYHNYQSIASLVVLANIFKKISAAANYTCGVRLNGELSCWGENTANQLLGASDAQLKQYDGGTPCTGDTNQTCVTRPLHIAVGHFFTDLTTGPTSACAIEKGTATTYCWGNNSGGLLGVNSSSELVPPTPLASPIQFQQISAGATHTCGISNGNGYCWGDNAQGELGNGGMTWVTGGGGSATPLQLPGTGWTQISAGNQFTFGIIASVAKCWGNDRYNLGAGWQTTHQSPDTVDRTYAPAAPSQLGNGSDATTMCAIMPAGGQNPGAWCWGYGVGDPNSVGMGKSYFPIQLPGAGVLTQVAIGSDQSCGLDGSGNALCWGSNEYGQFGDGDQQLVGIPTPTVVWGSAP
jgi:alpha-tubulin suppressor-like RCC1 family protein